MGYKEGTNRNQITMLSLNDLVAPESMVRVVDQFVEILDLKALGFTKAKPAYTGCPAYSPKALCKLYIYSYENGIRSSRKIERETTRNVEVMWLINSLMPSHKTISEFRRENIRPLQKLFREFVKLCKTWDLIGGEIIAVDGSKFKACNNKKNNFSRKKLDDRLARLDAHIKNYMDEIEAADSSEDKAQNQTNAVELQKLLERKEQYEDYKKHLDETGGNEISTVDPDARLMGNNRGGVEMAYNVISAVDGKHDIILDFDVSTNPSDQHHLSIMVKKVQRILKKKFFTALADKGFYNGEDLLKLKKYKVTAIVSKQKPSNPKDQLEEFWTERFIYDDSTDTYTCPKGHTLTSSNNKTSKRRNYRNKTACASCTHKSDCIKGNAKYRTVTRNQYSRIYEETDKRFKVNKELYKRRQEIVEHPFGTVKRTMNGGYFIIRTRRKVRTEIALLFLGYNLKRAVKILGFEEIMRRLNSLLLFLFAFMEIRVGKRWFALMV